MVNQIVFALFKTFFKTCKSNSAQLQQYKNVVYIAVNIGMWSDLHLKEVHNKYLESWHKICSSQVLNL